MCVGISFITVSEKIEKDLGIISDGVLRTSYNILPTQHSYVIRNHNHDQLDYITWGMVPYFSNNGQNDGKLAHARAENIFTSTSFRIPIRQRRCLVVVDSFYDWVIEADGSKSAYRFFHPNNELLCLAGVWDFWLKDNYKIMSFSIITSKYDKFTNMRMPIPLIDKTTRSKWLSDISLTEIDTILHGASVEALSKHKISASSLEEKANGLEMHVKQD